MFFLTFETRPKPSHPAYDEVGGALAAVFVNYAIIISAELAFLGVTGLPGKQSRGRTKDNVCFLLRAFGSGGLLRGLPAS